MTNRRGAGEGSVYRRKSDGQWVASLSARDATGRRARVVRYFKTQREAVAGLQVLRQESIDGRLSLDRQTTMAEFADHYLLTIKGSVAPATWRSYESLLRVHVLPELGRVPLARLTTPQVQKLLNGCLKKGSSPDTVRLILQVVRSVLALAVDYGVVGRNVTDAVRRPKLPAPVAEPLSREELEAVLAAAGSWRDRTLFLTAATTGLRLGELLALRWSDVDFDRAMIKVRGSLGRDGAIGELKSRAARREVNLPVQTARALAKHRNAQVASRLASLQPWAEPDRVFTTERGSSLLHRVVQRNWERAVIKAGLPRHPFKDLRKTYSSWLVEGGVDVKTAQILMGHADPRTTLQHYTRTSDVARRDAAERIQAALDEAAGG
jgi:integrase